jgi:hypothetical protein
VRTIARIEGGIAEYTQYRAQYNIAFKARSTHMKAIPRSIHSLCTERDAAPNAPSAVSAQ